MPKHSAVWECKPVYFDLLALEIAKKLEKSECWVIEWSWRNEGFEGKKLKGKTKSPE